MYVLWKHKVLIWFILTLSGIFGESSASPTSSRTTTETFRFKSTSFWNWAHWRNVSIIPSGLDNGLHWNDTIFTCNRSSFVSLLYKKIFKSKFLKNAKLYTSMSRYVFLKRYIDVLLYNKTKYQWNKETRHFKVKYILFLFLNESKKLTVYLAYTIGFIT